MLSIIIPNYNKYDLLQNCIVSILRNECNNIEIIVVDNGSSEKITLNIEDKRLKIITLNNNEGFSKAVNIGIKQAKGNYIAILNNDTEVDTYWIKNILKAFEQNPGIMYLTSKIKSLKNKELLDDVGDVILPSGKVYKIGYNERDTGQYGEPRYIFGASGCASVYRKEFFENVGYFDEDFFAYLEDIDISFRANLMGYKCLYVPDAVVYHVGSATTGSQYNDFTIFHLAQNTINVVTKNYINKLLIKSIPSVIIYILALQFFFLFKGGGIAFFKGLISGLQMNKKMRIKRKKIQEDCLITYKDISLVLDQNKKYYMLSKKNREAD